MQAIDIAAYKRLGDSYAGENGALLENSDENTDSATENDTNAVGSGTGVYEQLQGNSDSEDGYQTAGDTESENVHHRSYVYSMETGYQRSDEHVAKDSHRQSGNGKGYQSLSHQPYQSHKDFPETWSSENGQTEVPGKGGYFRLEGFSEFCGNFANLKTSEIKNGYSVLASDAKCETKKLCQDPQETQAEEVKIEPSPEFCSFRVLIKLCQMAFCTSALVCGFFAHTWLTTTVGVWFFVSNVFCAGVAGSVTLAILYHRLDRNVFCKRKVIRILYIVMLPMLLSSGLLGASVATSTRFRMEMEKTAIMVSSMFTLMGLFAVIGDMVMNRRAWRMFQIVGGNAYIHTAFMA